MEAEIQEAIRYLNRAKSEVADLEQARNESQSLNQERLRLQKALDAEEKALNDEINATVRRRRDEISSSYDAEITKAQEKLKRHRLRKAQAKNEGKKERIEYETSELREENRQLKSEFTSILKRHHIPKMCRSRWFYVLCMPTGIEHIFIILLAALLLYALPFGIYSQMGLTAGYMLTLLHVLAALIFAVPYVVVTEKVTFKHLEALKRTNSLRLHWEKNDTQMKKIARSINSDEGEELYDLDDYNYNIAKSEAMVDDLNKRKDEALESFDTVTAGVIEDELKEGSRERIEGLRENISDVTSQCVRAEDLVHQKTVTVTDRYAGMVGKENLTANNINGIMKVLQNGEAETITEAVAIYKSNIHV